MSRFSLTALLVAAVISTITAVENRSEQARRLERAPSEGRRLALVIGNNRYEGAPLVNAINDARAVSGALESVGFASSLLLDGTLESTDRAVETFVARIEPGDTAVIYYSGHGVQVDGENYLIPIDYRGSDEVALRRRSVNVSELQERLERRGARIRILILDACRDNPFRSARSATKGLAQYGAEGALIAYATGPGSTASDNPAGNFGLFTTHFLEVLSTPGVSVSEMFRTIRERVRNSSNGQQVPWLSDGLIGNFSFSAATAEAARTPAAPTGSTEDLRAREELLFWESIRDTHSTAVLDEYLRRYGADGRFAVIARDRLATLNRAAAKSNTIAPPVAPPPPAPGRSLDNPALFNEQAPPTYQVRLDTSAGPVLIQVTREWAPLGADRFYNLVKNGYYDGVRFFRVIAGFMAQGGMHGDPSIQRVWRSAHIPDDRVRRSNQRGYVSLAKTSSPNTRTTQFFINYRDNAFLDASGFAPIGQVLSGMDAVDKFTNYGKDEPDQGRINAEGNAYLQQNYPNLDFIKTATIEKSQY